MNAAYEFDPQWSSEFVTYGSYVSLVLRPDRVQEGSSSQIMVMGGNIFLAVEYKTLEMQASTIGSIIWLVVLGFGLASLEWPGDNEPRPRFRVLFGQLCRRMGGWVAHCVADSALLFDL